MTAIGQLVSRNGAADKFRFTAALANGRDLYAFRFAVNDDANTLYYRATTTSVLVVSEPLDNNIADWVEVPPNHVVIARADAPTEVVPFMEQQALAAE
jgi:glutamine amidotransferase